MSFFKNLFLSNKHKHQPPEILLEEKSPSCPITATVEQDNRVTYLYLWGPENSNFGMRSCWIRNIQAAPKHVDKTEMKNGIPPMMPQEFCKFPQGQEKLNKNDLKIIWLEEGEALALLSKEEILAIIPCWSGFDGFFGYARDAKGYGNFATELKQPNDLYHRIKDSSHFWNSWKKTPNPFQIQQPKILDVYDEVFGESDNYYAIDGEKWPPKGLYLRKGDLKTIFATVGVSLRPMPMVEMYAEDRLKSNRIELGLILDSQFDNDSIQEMAEWISGQAQIPWDQITFLGEGHTINFNPFSTTMFDSVILTSKLNILPSPQLENYRGSKINFLWMIPISQKERQHIIDNGSKHVLDELNKIGSSIFSLNRNEVI